jgi:hypothetical protein
MVAGEMSHSKVERWCVCSADSASHAHPVLPSFLTRQTAKTSGSSQTTRKIAKCASNSRKCEWRVIFKSSRMEASIADASSGSCYWHAQPALHVSGVRCMMAFAWCGTLTYVFWSQCRAGSSVAAAQAWHTFPVLCKPACVGETAAELPGIEALPDHLLERVLQLVLVPLHAVNDVPPAKDAIIEWTNLYCVSKRFVNARCACFSNGD